MSDLQQRWTRVQRYVMNDPTFAAWWEPVLEIATQSHEGQIRNDGSPFLQHGLETAELLVAWGLAPRIVLVGIMHDVVRYGQRYETVDSLRRTLPDAALTDLFEVTHNLAQYDSIFHYKRESDGLKRIIKAMLDDIDAVLIRCANRVVNLRHPDLFTPSQREALFRSTSDLYLPLLSRLGMWLVRVEVEDHLFKLQDPDYFRQIEQRRDQWMASQSPQLAEWRRSLLDALAARNIAPDSCTVEIVPWHVNAIKRKLQEMTDIGTPVESEKSLERLDETNYFTTHVVVGDVIAAYQALGAVHTCGEPQLGTFHDYYTSQARFGYAALHTMVTPPQRRPHRLYIRSENMHELAQRGILMEAAYATWCGRRDGRAISLDGWHPQEAAVLYNFIEYLRQEDQGRIHVLTPQGDVKSMRPGSTALDFAYAIHSDIGKTAERIYVNGREVPFDTPLHNGDMVLVTRDFNRFYPDPEWEQWVSNPSHRSIIRYQVRQRPERRGRRQLDDELRAQGSTTLNSLMPRLITLCRTLGTTLDELFISIANGTQPVAEIVEPLLSTGPAPAGSPNIEVELAPEERARLPHWGADLIKVVACCSPSPPDTIVGYHTSSGFELHRATCDQLLDRSRVVQLRWKTHKAGTPEADFHLRARSYDGLIFDLTNIIRRTKMRILHLEGRREGKMDEVRFRLQIPFEPDLGHLIEYVRSLPNYVTLEIDGVPWDSYTTAIERSARLRSPYTPTTPIKNPRDLHGRSAEITEIEWHLDGQSVETILMHGPKRIGKTSVLTTLPHRARLRRQYCILFVDLQGVSQQDSATTLRSFAWRLYRAAQKATLDVEEPALATFQSHPLQAFQAFVEALLAACPRNKDLLLLFDEFGNLVEAIKQGRLSDRLFEVLRHLNQDNSRLRMLFCASDEMLNLVSHQYIQRGLNAALTVPLGLLDDDDAWRLVQDGAISVGVHLDREAIQALVRVSGGHPFYLQHLCHRLMFHLGDMGRRTATHADIERVVERYIVDSRGIEFRHLWHDGHEEEFLLLQALSHPTLPTPATAHEIAALIQSVGGHTLPVTTIEQGLEHFREALVCERQRSRTGVDRYQIQVELFRRWFEYYYPLKQEPSFPNGVRH